MANTGSRFFVLSQANFILQNPNSLTAVQLLESSGVTTLKQQHSQAMSHGFHSNHCNILKRKKSEATFFFNLTK